MTLTAWDAPETTWEPLHGPRVVVGVDGSAHAVHALTAAACAAELLSVPLIAFTAWSGPGPEGQVVEAELAAAARRLQAETLRLAFRGREPAHLRRVVREGSPARVLIQESRGASLLVVGSRGTGGFAGLQVGSAGIACAARALCPVLLVKRPPASGVDLDGPPRIVVGVDGSRPSIAALRAAVRATGRLHGRLDVVTVWQPLPDEGPIRGDALASAAHARQSAALAAVLGARLPEDVHPELRSGSPAGVLVQASRSADLLVIGSRAQGTVSGVLFGGVTMVCAQHAASNVLIVHAPDVPED